MQKIPLKLEKGNEESNMNLGKKENIKGKVTSNW